MRTKVLTMLAFWVGCCSGGALGKEAPSLREAIALPTLRGLPTPQPVPLSPPGSPDGQVRLIPRNNGPARPEDRQLDWPQARPTLGERAHRAPLQPQAPSWKQPARPGLPQRKELSPAALEQERVQPQATTILEAAVGRPRARKLRPLWASGTLRPREGAVSTEEGQGRKAGGRDARRRGLKLPRRPPKGASCQPALVSQHPQKDRSRGHIGDGSSTLEVTGRGQKRPAGLGMAEQALLSLPASCLLAQAAVACRNVKMKHIPTLNAPGLTALYLAGLCQLLTLEVEGNQLHDRDISPLAFQPLRSLLYLRLDRNQLRTIPPGLPASLQELHLDTNHIEEVREDVLNGSRSLSVLVLSNNRLQEDRLASRAWIDLPKLETLDLSHNRLVHVPSFLPRGLRRLALHHNRIERIPGYVFAHMKPGLEFLHLSHNSLRDNGIHAVSFLGLHSSLAELLLDNNQLQAIPRGLLGLKGLQVLHLSHNKIRHVPLNSICDTRVAQDSNLISTHLENNLIDRRRIPPTAFSCIRAYHSVVLQPQQGEAS
ncbi:biglycan-like isoform X3 [Loxodonta africana]|uniref:biglycan-like isoform X3 n=1 Tax=Loxodonta africana TaxID=9785 RepID=UPI0030CDA433